MQSKYRIKTSVEIEVWADSPLAAADLAVDKVVEVPDMFLLEVHGYQVFSPPKDTDA